LVWGMFIILMKFERARMVVGMGEKYELTPQ
jgi:hypothetical protein